MKLPESVAGNETCTSILLCDLNSHYGGMMSLSFMLFLTLFLLK